MGARLGQHFLNAPWAAHALVDAVSVRPHETIVEVGPGKGALTAILLETGAPVIAIEKDERLAAQLHETFSAALENGQLQIQTGDIRNFLPKKDSLPSYVVAANIPYYITGEIIRMFLTAEHQPRALSLLIQKEVAQRIIARDGKESLLSLSVKAYGTPRFVAKVGKGAFSPPPQVDSAILCIENVTRDFFATMLESDFFDVLHAGFASKRKKLAGNLLKKYGERTRETLERCNISKDIRAEDVTLLEWRTIVHDIVSSR